MPRNKKGVYIVSLIAEDGRKLYYMRQQCQLIEEGGQVLSEPLGVFSYDLIDAKKYIDRSGAEWTASFFDGAGVEFIKEGERLK